MSPTVKRKLGNIGEDLTEKYIVEKKYNILAKNYTKKCGEIDIIAQKGDIIAFIEVKTRKKNALVSPLESVTPSKQEKIIKTAEAFLFENEEYSRLQPRFDVSAVTDDRGIFTIEYFENAFY